MANCSSANIQKLATIFSLAWLAIANAVGVLLAILLIWPRLNDTLAPFTYGRWIPLHMDWQLYGWCSLPLLGLLFLRFFGNEKEAKLWVSLSYWFWSIGLLAGGIAWLSGEATGKPFLNWTGLSGSVFAGAQLGIWTLLAISFCKSIRVRKIEKESTLGLSLKGVVLLGLIGVPFVLLFTSNPEVYPPINPQSGGATGHSLLASTLSLVFLMGLLPGAILRLNKRDSSRTSWIARVFWLCYVASLFLYLGIEHGNVSNHEWNQIFGLGSLLAWPFCVAVLWSRYEWSAEAKIWRWAFYFWWAFLAIDGWVIFLPGILDTLKFTNGLVAHSHLAMGGMVTCLNMLILLEMGSSPLARRVLGGRFAWSFWNGGCLLYVVVMTGQGWREGLEPSALFSFDRVTAFAYSLRLVAGVMMLGASLQWFVSWMSCRTRVGSTVYGGEYRRFLVVSCSLRFPRKEPFQF